MGTGGTVSRSACERARRRRRRRAPLAASRARRDQGRSAHLGGACAQPTGTAHRAGAMNDARSETDGPTKIAILGGGCGGLAAAWALTATPALRERFEVTVYEHSWALNGKGASGRMPDSWGQNGRGQRIHEHGLHIWFGFYVHAFRMLRGAYEESGLASGDDWWKLPFQKCDEV